MSKFLKSVSKAAHNAVNPNELKELDNLVDKLLKSYDSWVQNYPNDGTPPNKEQAKAEEEAKFAQLNTEYDHKAEDYCDRKPKDKDDNISVRKRQLNRGLKAREDKLFSRFSGEVAGLKELAAATLKTALDTSNDFDDVMRAQFPLPVDHIISEFEKMKADIEAQIDSSFPGASEGLDNYDDALPEGVPSYKDLKARWPGILDAVLAENAAAVDAAVESIKVHSAESLRAAVQAALQAEREQYASLELPWLPADRTAELKAHLEEATYGYGIPRE